MLSPPARFRYEDDPEPSEVIAWYNQHVDPVHVGSYRAISGEHVTLQQTIDDCFRTLPVSLDAVLDCLEDDHEDLFLQGDVLERLLITVFNEEDHRISSNDSKDQVLYILTYLLQHPGTARFTSRQMRVRIRIALQRVQDWIDEIVPGEDITSDYVSLSTYST